MVHLRIVVLLWMLLPSVGCATAPETPREELAQRNIPFSEEAFLRSAEDGDLIAVNLFLAADMNPNVKDQYGGTALRYAAAKGHVAVVQALLDKGANVNVQDTDGFTPLRYAVYNGHTEIVRTLLDHGANPTVRGKWGWTPVMVAAGRGQVDILQLLESAENQQ